MPTFDESALRQLSEDEFHEILRFVPSVQQHAHLLVRYLPLSYQDVVHIRAGAIDEEGLRYKGQSYRWQDERLWAEHLRAIREDARDEERIVEPQKPLVKAIYDLPNSFQAGIKRKALAEKLASQPSEGRLPNFLVLGTPKSGTTWLYHYLATHPDVFVTPEKEPEFFGTHLFQLGENWYRNLFLDWRGEKLGGDVSVGYFQEPSAAGQIAGLLDKQALKLIVLLREPLSRALSYYDYRFRRGEAPLTFEQSLQSWYFKRLYIQPSHYVHFLEKYLSFFDRTQIKIILFDEIQADPLNVLKDVYTFLNVEPEIKIEDAENRVNAGTQIQYRRLHLALQYLRFYGKAHLSAPNARRIDHIVNSLTQKILVSERREPEGVSSALLAQFQEIFAESNAQLSALSGIDVSHWQSSG